MNDANDKLYELIDCLAKVEYNIKEHHGLLLDMLQAVYFDDEGNKRRLQYSRVSKILYDNYWKNTEACDTICIGLGELREFVANENELVNAIDELLDHVTLESLRIGRLQEAVGQSRSVLDGFARIDQERAEASNKVSQLTQEVGQLQSQIKDLLDNGVTRLENEVNAQINRLDDTIAKHNLETATVLSIFACVVFAFSGGFSMLSGALSSLPDITRARSPFFLACIFALGLVLYDCIFLLLRFTRRIILDHEGRKQEGYWPAAVINVGGIITVLVLLVLYYQ